jgi:hypothetical protein
MEWYGRAIWMAALLGDGTRQELVTFRRPRRFARRKRNESPYIGVHEREHAYIGCVGVSPW